MWGRGANPTPPPVKHGTGIFIRLEIKTRKDKWSITGMPAVLEYMNNAIELNQILNARITTKAIQSVVNILIYGLDLH